MTDQANVSRIIRPKEVARLLGISKATLYRWEKEGRLAPRVILGPGTSGWREIDIKEFIDTAIKKRAHGEDHFQGIPNEHG